VDATGKPALVRPTVPHSKLLELIIISLPPCFIGMEACSGAHHWSRESGRFDHTVRLMAPKFVITCRLSDKRSNKGVSQNSGKIARQEILDPAMERLYAWCLSLETVFRLFSKFGSLGCSIQKRYSRMWRTGPILGACRTLTPCPNAIWTRQSVHPLKVDCRHEPLHHR